MSDLIRAIGMKMSEKGTCNKCGELRSAGDHSKCDRWPTQYGMGKGFHFVGNSRETNHLAFKRVIDALIAGEAHETPIRFELRIMQTRNVDNQLPNPTVATEES